MAREAKKILTVQSDGVFYFKERKVILNAKELIFTGLGSINKIYNNLGYIISVITFNILTFPLKDFLLKFAKH